MLLPWKGKKSYLKTTKPSVTFHPVTRKRPSRTSVGGCWDCVALLFIRHLFFLVYNVHERGGKAIYGIPVVVRWSVGGTFEVWGEETGCTMLNGCAEDTHHPSSTGIKNCTSTTVLFFFPLSFSAHESFCVWKENKHHPFKYLFVNPSKHTGNGEKS